MPEPLLDCLTEDASGRPLFAIRPDGLDRFLAAFLQAPQVSSETPGLLAGQGTASCCPARTVSIPRSWVLAKTVHLLSSDHFPSRSPEQRMATAGW